MSKYIDAEKLIAEIDRLNSLVPYGNKDRHDEGLHDAYKAVENVITSLQQEQPEVDLEKGGITMIPKPMYVRTRVHTLQEGWDLCCAIMRKGYEGVQNDSSRYNDLQLSFAFKQNGYCWVGVWGYSLHILNTHDKKGRRRLKDLGKCKFIEELGLSVCKRDMTKTLRFYEREEK